MSTLTAERLREVLRYEPETGRFFWRLQISVASSAGSEAGYVSKRGYKKIAIDYEDHLAHRLAFLYVTGRWPKEVDHIDNDKTNDRWVNLREANRSQNAANIGMRRNNTSGYKGVCFNRSRGKWQANIEKNGKKRTIGCFGSPEEAYAAYCRVALELFGEFARVA